MTSKIWDFWANKYHKLWVQKYSLKPTRDYILKAISKSSLKKQNSKVLDLGCGPGELIGLIQKEYPDFQIMGIDYSKEMIKVSKEKNSQAIHKCMDAAELNSLTEDFDLIICTHSLPYYKSTEKVIAELYRLLKDDGTLLMGFASGNSFYDKFCLSFVKLTTGPANYPSDLQFRELVKEYFEITETGIIKKKFFMPRIAIYTLRKVKY